MNKVIIVESPSKSKTIGTYLGKGYTVLSSKGHICDLATSGKDGLGIDIDNGFTPNYKISPDKQKLVNQLKAECKGKKVYLATDPDREGEAIAYHLANVLELDLNDDNRIEFHEITKTAVNEALKTPHKIDLQMVDSQEARRMIDRILGFRLSKLMQRKINSKSAGRVQSVALLLVVNREKEILAFIPTKYFEIEASYLGHKIKLNTLDGNVIDNENRILDRTVLERLLPELKEFEVLNIESKDTKRQSYPTYTTSTLQQDASNKLSFAPTKTMNVAQKLYEGKNIGSETVGLITYMRTDSTRLADSFVKDVTDFILDNYGEKYVGKLKIKSQKGQQDAHEGIRPTSIKRTPESIKDYLSTDEYKLYKLIYNRTLASLMSAAVYKSTKIELSNTRTTWSMNGSVLKFDGYQKIYNREEDDKDDLLPNLNVGDKFNADSIDILDKETTPKPRYTEASLIKEMEDLGIGRPSTYAQTIYTLKEREYVTLDKRTLLPSQQGILTSDKLQEFFDGIVNVKYTANMETHLDEIAKGTKDKLSELSKFYKNFEPLYENAKTGMESKYPQLTGEMCPKCGNPLYLRLGKYGEFVSCSNYPYCNYIKHDEQEDNDTHILCPKCGKSTILIKTAKTGKNKGHVFYACGNYPKCKTIFNDMPTEEKCPKCGAIMLKDKDGNLYCSEKCDEEKMEEFICPKCGKGHFVERVALRGRNKGNKFYACSNYPKCKTMLNGKPTHEVCPNCGSMMVIDKDGNLVCNENCTKKDIVKEEPKKEVAQEATNEKEVICPKCGKGHLVLRVAKTGANKGNQFYGCSNFPRCKNLVSIEEYNNLIK